MKMIWIGYVACMTEDINVQKGSVGNLRVGHPMIMHSQTDGPFTKYR
jgi:hypothetical protein